MSQSVTPCTTPDFVVVYLFVCFFNVGSGNPTQVHMLRKQTFSD